MNCAMNSLNSVNSCATEAQSILFLIVALKNPLWESAVGALHCTGAVPKIASKSCA